MEFHSQALLDSTVLSHGSAIPPVVKAPRNVCIQVGQIDNDAESNDCVQEVAHQESGVGVRDKVRQNVHVVAPQQGYHVVEVVQASLAPVPERHRVTLYDNGRLDQKDCGCNLEPGFVVEHDKCSKARSYEAEKENVDWRS